MKRNGLRGQPCLLPVAALKVGESSPASDTKNNGALYIDMIGVEGKLCV